MGVLFIYPLTLGVRNCVHPHCKHHCNRVAHVSQNWNFMSRLNKSPSHQVLEDFRIAQVLSSPSLTFQAACTYYTCLIDMPQSEHERELTPQGRSTTRWIMLFFSWVTTMKCYRKGGEVFVPVIPSQECRTADLQLPGQIYDSKSRSLVKQLMPFSVGQDETPCDTVTEMLRRGSVLLVSFFFGNLRNRWRTFFFHWTMKKLPFVTILRKELIKNYTILCTRQGVMSFLPFHKCQPAGTCHGRMNNRRKC